MLPENFPGCENFRNLRIFVGYKISQCENSQPAETVHRHPVLACNSPFAYNSSFHAPAINFFNFLNHPINGH